MAPPVKKKRWPWIVLAVVLLCGLPLGGCVALVTFGVNEISERKEAVEDTTTQFFTSIIDDDVALASVIDGDPPCAVETELQQAADSIGSPGDWEFSRTAFVDRTGSGYISSNADPDTFALPGREGGSLASVTGAITTSSGSYDFEIILTKPLASWRVCSVVFE